MDGEGIDRERYHAPLAVGEGSIAERFERIAAIYADHIAIETEAETVLYGELDRSANRIANAIVERCGDGDEPIALLVAQGPVLIAAALGAIKAGKVGAAIDPLLPEPRMAAMARDMMPQLVVADRAHRALAARVAGESRRILDIEDVTASAGELAPRVRIGADRMGWILYTSGSTGTPQGVIRTHRQFLHYAGIDGETYGLGPADRLMTFGTLRSAQDLTKSFAALLNGAAICMFDIFRHGAARLAGWLSARRITFLQTVPSVFRTVVGDLDAGEHFPELRLLCLSGERVARDDFEAYKRCLSSRCLFASRMGSSETGPVATVLLDKSCSVTTDSVPIGRPVRGATVILVDDERRPVSDEVGQIAVRSRFLSPGYWNNAELTRARFLPDAEGSDVRTYLTGDLGRFLPDGTIEHRGRVDHMVKVRGMRVELAEIEAAIRRHPSIRDCAVAMAPHPSGGPQLVGYLVGRTAAELDAGALRDHLGSTLPDYMVPATFVRLDELPRTTTGKLDRRALPDPDWGARARRGGGKPARSDLEKALCDIWEAVLGVDRIGIDENFFQLGGHSLLAARVLAEVYRRLGVDLPVSCIMTGPTIERLSAAIADAAPVAAVALPGSDEGEEATETVYSGWSIFGPRIAAAYRLRGELSREALRRAFEAVVHRHSELRTCIQRVDGCWRRRIQSPDRVELPVEALAPRPGEELADALARAVAEFRDHGLDLTAGPVFEARLFELGPADHLLVWKTFHALADGYSLQIMFRDLRELYAAFASGQPPALSPLAATPRKVREWLDAYEAGGMGSRDRAYWMKQLAGMNSELAHPAVKRPSRTGTTGGPYAKVPLAFEPELVERIRDFASGHATTLYVTLLAGLRVLFFRYSGQQDLIIHTLSPRRVKADWIDLVVNVPVGLFIRGRVASGSAFLGVVRAEHDTVAAAYTHQVGSGPPLWAMLREAGALAPSEFPRLKFNYLALGVVPTTMPGLEVTAMEPLGRHGQFDIDVWCREWKGELLFSFVYRTDMLERSVIEELATGYRQLMKHAIERPHDSVSDLPIAFSFGNPGGGGR